MKKEKKNIILYGKNVDDGKDSGVVIGKGIKNEIGKIRNEMYENEEIKNNLKKKMDEFGEKI